MTNAYITNFGGSIEVINTATDIVTATISISGTRLLGVAVSSDGSKVYAVDNETSAGSVYVINTATNAILASIPVGTGTNAWGIAVTPDGTKAYVPGSPVTVINTQNNTVLATFSLAGQPIGAAISSDSSKAYLTLLKTPGELIVINTSNNAILSTISTGSSSGPQGVAITPNGNFAYVTNNSAGTVSVFNLNNGAGVD